MNASLLHLITSRLNGIAMAIFLSVEFFWFIRQNKKLKDSPSLLGGFFIYNLPFVLRISRLLAALWAEVVRLLVLLICISVNLWLHYHGDKGGNSVGMAIVFFLLVSVPLIVIMEILIAIVP